MGVYMQKQYVFIFRHMLVFNVLKVQKNYSSSSSASTLGPAWSPSSSASTFIALVDGPGEGCFSLLSAGAGDWFFLLGGAGDSLPRAEGAGEFLLSGVLLLLLPRDSPAGNNGPESIPCYKYPPKIHTVIFQTMLNCFINWEGFQEFLLSTDFQAKLSYCLVPI